jgi:4,5-DOPA dioxygenase extradiol
MRNPRPSLFVSHGAPTFALEPGLAGARLGELGRALPRPAALLLVFTTLYDRRAQGDDFGAAAHAA